MAQPASRASLQADPQQLRNDFIEEARSSLRAYQQTGKHLTHKEVQDWLQSWGSQNERKLPECHS